MPSSKPRWPYYTVAGLFIAGTIAVTIVFSERLAKDDAYIAYVALAVAVVATIVGELLADRDLLRVVKLWVNAATAWPLVTALGVLGVALIKDDAGTDVIAAIVVLALLAVVFPFVAYRYAGDDRVTRELKAVQSKLAEAEREVESLRRQRRRLAAKVLEVAREARDQRLAKEAAEAELRARSPEQPPERHQHAAAADGWLRQAWRFIDLARRAR